MHPRPRPPARACVKIGTHPIQPFPPALCPSLASHTHTLMPAQTNRRAPPHSTFTPATHPPTAPLPPPPPPATHRRQDRDAPPHPPVLALHHQGVHAPALQRGREQGPHSALPHRWGRGGGGRGQGAQHRDGGLYGLGAWGPGVGCSRTQPAPLVCVCARSCVALRVRASAPCPLLHAHMPASQQPRDLANKPAHLPSALDLPFPPLRPIHSTQSTPTPTTRTSWATTTASAGRATRACG